MEFEIKIIYIHIYICIYINYIDSCPNEMPRYNDDKNCIKKGVPRWLCGRNSLTKQDMQVQSMGWEDSLEKEIFSWKRPPIPILLPGKSYGQRSLESYSSWGSKRV